MIGSRRRCRAITLVDVACRRGVRGREGHVAGIGNNGKDQPHDGGNSHRGRRYGDSIGIGLRQLRTGHDANSSWINLPRSSIIDPPRQSPFRLSGNGSHSHRRAALRHETKVPWRAEYSRENQAAGGTVVPNPALRANTIACGRFSTSSFEKTLVIWLRTVLALTPSCAAIWALSRPCAISSIKSSSRGVSDPNAASG